MTCACCQTSEITSQTRGIELCYECATFVRPIWDKNDDLVACVTTLQEEFEAYKIEHHDCVLQALDESVAVHNEIEARRDGLETEVTKLREERDQQDSAVLSLADQYHAQETRADAAERRVQALEAYMQHHGDCESIGGRWENDDPDALLPQRFVEAVRCQCTCGLAELKK